MNNNFLLTSLPLQSQQLVIQFLSREDIFINLQATCKEAKVIIENPIILINILQRRVPTFTKQIYLQNRTQPPFRDTYNLKDLKKLIQSSPDHMYELPFWGFRTNGGVSQHFLKHWIGKTFSKSKDQLIATKLIKDVNKLINYEVYIEGTLSYDIINYKSSLLTMATYILIHQNVTNQIIKFRDIKISQIIDLALQLRHHLCQDLISQATKLFESAFCQFSSYLESMCQYYHDVSNLDIYNLNKKPQNIPNIIAHVQNIEISREGYLQTPIKTCMILGSLKSFDQFDDQLLQVKSMCLNYKQAYKCNSIEKAKSMMSEWGYDKQDIYDKQVQYLTVTQQIDQNGINRDYFPLLWFSFGSGQNKILKYSINLPIQAQCYVCNILLIMIDVDDSISKILILVQEQQPQMDFYEESSIKLQGLGLSYVSLKGQVITTDGRKFLDYDI